MVVPQHSTIVQRARPRSRTKGGEMRGPIHQTRRRRAMSNIVIDATAEKLKAKTNERLRVRRTHGISPREMASP